MDTYYSEISFDDSKELLQQSLQQLLASTHTVVPYTSSATDVWDALKVLDEDPSDSDK